MNVSFLDLKAQYKTIKDEIDASMQEVVDSCAFAGGPFVEKFENEWARYCSVKHAIGVGNGTDALWLPLLALGIGSGDEVITVSNTFIATVEAICYTGATPVFVDVDEETSTMNPALLEAAITPRTKAVIPVHLFGQAADMDPIMAIARRHGLYVIEDACQAHGAMYKGRKAGSIGDAGAFSFYPGKNLGAYGEGGAVTTNNDDVARKVRMLRDHGQSRKYYHDLVGWNARLDGIQGAVLSVKLRHLEDWTESRRRHAERYTRALKGIAGIDTPYERTGGRHVYHLYVVRVENRDAVAAALHEKGIGTGIHYPVPIHQQGCFRDGYSKCCLPVTEKFAARILSLPMFAELTDEGVDHVCSSLAEILGAPDNKPVGIGALASKQQTVCAGKK
jgi:dTDP-4-amino-4,6-dideoxygalactose transaminase